MAHYDYYCAHCGTTVEISHPITASPEILCADCSQPRIKKFGVGAVTFKGSGWGKDS